MSATSPRALFLLLFGALLLAASASSPVAAAGDSFVHAGRRAAGGAGETAMWQRLRRLEDDVAPEFPSAAVGGSPPGISYDTLNSKKQVCIKGCAAKGPGVPYTRPCSYAERCR